MIVRQLEIDKKQHFSPRLLPYLSLSHFLRLRSAPGLVLEVCGEEHFVDYLELSENLPFSD